MEKKKILVVDDEMDQRIFISTVLETSGYQSIVTKEGREAIRKAKETVPDLVILDVMMPGEGGAQMYREIKSDPKLKTVPVIMLSAVEKRSFYHYLKMLNAKLKAPIPLPAAYLEKPLDPEELIDTIKTILADKTAAK
ncbi:MAG: response regulator [Desulfobacterales bacterium]|jgi:CheY-like chemotaxis protein